MSAQSSLPARTGDRSRARRDLALRQADLDAHWDPRSRGVAAGSEGGWLFTGRTELMRSLIQATTGTAQPVLVTGAAGSGSRRYWPVWSL